MVHGCPYTIEEEGITQQNQRNEVSDFNLFLIRKNSRRFRNLALLGKEAMFCLRPLLQDIEIYNWFENTFREIYAYVHRIRRLRRIFA